MAKREKKSKSKRPFYPIPAAVSETVSFADPSTDGFERVYKSMRRMEVERSMLKDPMRTAIVVHGSKADKTKTAKICLGKINRLFAPGSYVCLNTLKHMKVVSQNATFLKIKAKGKVNKPLIVEANEFKKKAVAMLTLTGGRAVIVK